MQSAIAPEFQHDWANLTSNDFAALDPERTIVIQPIAAIEQHGPHLPVATDTAIGTGMLSLLRRRLPDDLSILVLPIQAVGKSNEHILSPGTLSLSAETLTRVLVDIGESVHRAGLRKIVIANSHGGNTALLAVVTRELRVRFGMLAVATHWGSFGLPEGLYDPVEAKHGIHAGDIETSLMLAFRPDLVRRDKCKDFVSNAIAIENEFAHLTADSRHAFAWIAQDLHPDGAMGNATIADAEKGQKTALHQVDGFIGLLRDMTNFSLSRLVTVATAPSR